MTSNTNSSNWMKAHENDIEWLMFHCNDDRAIAQMDWQTISSSDDAETTEVKLVVVDQPVDQFATDAVIAA